MPMGMAAPEPAGAPAAGVVSVAPAGVSVAGAVVAAPLPAAVGAVVGAPPLTAVGALVSAPQAVRRSAASKGTTSTRGRMVYTPLRQRERRRKPNRGRPEAWCGAEYSTAPRSCQRAWQAAAPRRPE